MRPEVTAPDPLAAIGMKLVGRDDDAVHAECVRIARRLNASGVKIVGFVPATDRVAVPPVALELGSALVELTGATVALVDANVRYPAMASIADEPDAGRAGLYRTKWLRPSLAMLTPPSTHHRAGEAVPALARLLLDGVPLFRHVLVDLTGFDLLGEHASAAACMDGVIVVGQAHRTRERQILRYAEEMPPERLLGVLLVG